MKAIAAILLLSLALPVFSSAQKDSPLIKAIKKEDIQAARTLVEKGQYIAQADADGKVPLHHVALELYMIEQHKAKPAVFPPRKYRSADWLNLAKKMIEKGAPVNTPDKGGLTPLSAALVFAPVELPDVLVEAGATPPADSQYLLNAVNGSPRLTRYYLDRGISPNKKNLKGESILHRAVLSNKIEIVRLLLEHRANPNVVTPAQQGFFSGLTPLHYAAIYGQADMAELLLKSGADIEAVSASGKSALHYAVSGPRLEEAPGVGKEMEDVFISGGNPATVEKLLVTGVNLHTRDAAGATPLHWAVYYRQLAIADLLMMHGATPEVELKTSPDHLFATGLSNLWYCLHTDSLADRAAYMSKANRFFAEAEQVYQQQIEKINLKQVGTILVQVVVTAALLAAATYQATVTADAYGYGISIIDYPVISSQDIKGQKKYLKAQKKICVKLMEWSQTARSLQGQTAKKEVAAILKAKNDPEEGE